MNKFLVVQTHVFRICYKYSVPKQFVYISHLIRRVYEKYIKWWKKKLSRVI